MGVGPSFISSKNSGNAKMWSTVTHPKPTFPTSPDLGQSLLMFLFASDCFWIILISCEHLKNSFKIFSGLKIQT